MSDLKLLLQITTTNYNFIASKNLAIFKNKLVVFQF